MRAGVSLLLSLLRSAALRAALRAQPEVSQPPSRRQHQGGSWHTVKQAAKHTDKQEHKHKQEGGSLHTVKQTKHTKHTKYTVKQAAAPSRKMHRQLPTQSHQGVGPSKLLLKPHRLSTMVVRCEANTGVHRQPLSLTAILVSQILWLALSIHTVN